jgi:hypothetical protein
MSSTKLHSSNAATHSSIGRPWQGLHHLIMIIEKVIRDFDVLGRSRLPGGLTINSHTMGSSFSLPIKHSEQYTAKWVTPPQRAFSATPTPSYWALRFPFRDAEGGVERFVPDSCASREIVRGKIWPLRLQLREIATGDRNSNAAHLCP